MIARRPRARENERIDFDRDADVESAEKVLLEIADDARKLKNRYLKETLVPEGGE